MRNRTLATVYAIFCTLLLLGGGLACFIASCFAGITSMALAVIGLALGIILAPILHELGHVVFASANGFRTVYFKAFCFAVERKGKHSNFRFASPFAPDETQVLPMSGNAIKPRAYRYTVGGLVFSGLLWVILLLVSILTSVLLGVNYLLWGLSVYTGYLFLLNVMPLEYASGKTDALVAHGIKSGADCESVMLSAMQIQGEAYAGKRYGEMDKSLFFNLPVLAEDEPLFAVITQLRYRYFVDVEDFKNASLQINRLAELQPYLTDEEILRVCAELVFLHSLNGDRENAEACGAYCKEFLKTETVTAKRVLATFTFAFGEYEKAEILKEDGLRLLQNESMEGERLWEEKLLLRIKT